MIGWVSIGRGSLSSALPQPWETSGCVWVSGWNPLRKDGHPSLQSSTFGDQLGTWGMGSKGPRNGSFS